MRKISEIFINGVCLEKILENHQKWLDRKDDGEKANLNGADLRNADLRDVNLISADLRDANLSDADLSDANLKFADLGDADLRNTDLSDADLSNSDLKFANLIDAYLFGANLKCANLKCADLRGADLRSANLRNADLSSADLKGADLGYANLGYANLKLTNLNKVSYNHQTSFFAMQCPEKGSFVGYKKADNKIVELLITEDSKRSSATTRKCRCSKAKVLSITNIENTKEYNEVVSDYDEDFIYRVGEIVEVENFNNDRWNECSTGIHFFITRDEAIIYKN